MILCKHCKDTHATVEVMKESKVYQKKERLYLCDVCECFDRYDGINWTWRTTTPYVQQQTLYTQHCIHNISQQYIHPEDNIYTTS